MLYATEEKDELDYPCCQVWDHADKVLRAIRVDQQYIQSFYYRFDPASF
jgi:hypothetical protein